MIGPYFTEPKDSNGQGISMLIVVKHTMKGSKWTGTLCKLNSVKLTTMEGTHTLWDTSNLAWRSPAGPTDRSEIDEFCAGRATCHYALGVPQVMRTSNAMAAAATSHGMVTAGLTTCFLQGLIGSCPEIRAISTLVQPVPCILVYVDVPLRWHSGNEGSEFLSKKMALTPDKLTVGEN